MSALPVPAEVLPHRPPFLFVTEVTAVEPGVSARGHWDLTGDEPFFGLLAAVLAEDRYGVAVQADRSRSATLGRAFNSLPAHDRG